MPFCKVKFQIKVGGEEKKKITVDFSEISWLGKVTVNLRAKVRVEFMVKIKDKIKVKLKKKKKKKT